MAGGGNLAAMCGYSHFKTIGDAPGARIFMVGDRKFDMIGANNCGIPGVGVYFGYAEPGELEAAGAQYIARDVPALERILLSLCEGEQ